jgi:hypothetical protein
MNAKEAWANLIDCFFLKCRGESWLELKDAINAYTDLAVAEARAPLVEALRAALHALTTYQGLWASDECRDGGDYSFQLSDTALLDQITDILGPPTGQPEAGDATEMHGV